MDIFEKLTILTDAAKYDVACTSSGVERKGEKGGIGSAASCGICHSFAADGRCISLLKVLQSNACVYDCSYCVNRHSNDVKRATFTAEELADLTIQFYRRNYIEGLFLSSGIIGTPDDTCQLMIRTLTLLREEHRFGGYIHCKTIPGADPRLLARLGLLADRMSVNIELPSANSLQLLAPQKTKESILRPMGFISQGIQENTTDLVRYQRAPKFSPAGQATQMIVGASPETDYQIINLTAALYKKYQLKRVFYSAYIPMAVNSNLPALDTKPPLLREHRLYQADWLLRFYRFDAHELLSPEFPNFNPLVDPKCNWALNHLDDFPVEVNRADYDTLLRVPGLGVRSAQRIVKARRASRLDFDGLKKIGVVLKRAQYFITCNGKARQGVSLHRESVLRAMLSDDAMDRMQAGQQMSLFETSREDLQKCLTGQL